jgi:hypothetical protein
MKPKQPAGPPMTLGNMRELGVQRLLVSCLNPDCLHSIVFDVSHYDADLAVPSFKPRMRCSPVCWQAHRRAPKLERTAAE